MGLQVNPGFRQRSDGRLVSTQPSHSSRGGPSYYPNLHSVMPRGHRLSVSLFGMQDDGLVRHRSRGSKSLIP